jgi:sugar phosphate isomerase/epimerase
MPHLSLNPQECDPAQIKSLAEAHGLKIANLGTYVGKGFASDDLAVQQEELKQMYVAIDLAVMFGAHTIRVSPGNDDAKMVDRLIPWFQRSAAYAQRKNIRLGFENHGGGISGNPLVCKQLAAEVENPYFGVLYEPCNLLAAGVDYHKAFDIMKGHITHVHFKDGATTPSGFQRTMIGEGVIDFLWVIKQLDASGYKGDWALEYEIHDEPPETGLKKWYQWFNALK